MAQGSEFDPTQPNYDPTGQVSQDPTAQTNPQPRTPTPGTPPGPGTGGSQDWTKGPWDEARVAAYFQSRGVTPGPLSAAYWAQRWNEWGKNDPAYFLQRLSQADEFTGGGGQAGGNFGAYTNPFGGTFTPPPTVDLGGHSGLPYIPDLPQFKAPTLQDVLQDPSYQFRLGQGQQALEQSAAARGLLGTGGTLKDILNYGQSAASQEYGNIWNRRMAEYQPLLQQWGTLAQAGQHANDTNYQHAWDKYLQDYNQYRNWQNDAFDKSYRTTIA